MMGFIVGCLIVSLVGCAGITTCPPRPRAQEFWGFVALAPLFAIFFVLLLRVGHS